MFNPAIELEFKKAHAARAKGNEGMARVCARRAAGMAAKAFLQQQDIPITGSSAYDHLRALAQINTLPVAAQQAIAHLLARVDRDFQLPSGVDLLEDARLLIKELESPNWQHGIIFL